MRTLQRESNEDSYWWLDGEAPKNTSRNVGHRRRFKRSCQSLRGASQEAPVRNANLWVFVLDPNTASAFRPPAMPTNARSMTTKRLTKGKGGLCPTSLVAILKHPRQHEVQKNRQAGIPFQFLLHHPLLCFRAVYRRYRQQLLFQRPLIKCPFFHLRCQCHVQPTTQQLKISTTALQIPKTILGRNQQTKPTLHEWNVRSVRFQEVPSVSVRKRRGAYII